MEPGDFLLRGKRRRPLAEDSENAREDDTLRVLCTRLDPAGRPPAVREEGYDEENQDTTVGETPSGQGDGQ